MIYGIDLIRMKLVLDNFFDYMYFDRFFFGFFFVFSRFLVFVGRRFLLLVIIFIILDAGWGLGREGGVGFWERRYIR